MKILYLIPSFANKAGTERVISDKINFLAENGYEITFVTYEQGYHSFAYPLHQSIRFIDLNTRFFEVRQRPLYYRPFLIYLLRKQFRARFQKTVDEINPDILICTTYSFKLLDIILSINTKAKRIVESHVACYTIKKTYEYRNIPILRNIAPLYDSYVFARLKRCDMMVVLTEGDASEWRKYVPLVEVIPNPVTTYPEQVLAHDGTGRRIICVGRLHEQKGFDMLIDAFALIASKCPDWRITIYGDGQQKQFLLEKIDSLNLKQRVIICPPTSNIYEEYQKSEFLVLSSRYEGYSLVLNEAMSCGIPCVAYRCKYGPEDVIEHKKTGLLVDNGNVQDLADKILWMTIHTEERLQMGKLARENVFRFRKSEIMKCWLALFSKLEV